ncbi:hypothetical protein BDZ89DRAFT_1076924 [Hymenopellis radicata]|nr:hypothetical protein BDZ89DRAFT_1076924 [Hymenopellis radicata]
MDDFSYAMPQTYYIQPTAPWYPMEEYSGDAAHALEDRSLPRDLTSFPPTQLDPLHAFNLYPSLPISAERTLEYHPFPQDLPSFPPTNGVPVGDPPNIERVNSDRQSEVQDVESDPEDMDPDSESEPDDHPLPADAARWISMSPTQFDREYPGGNPFVIQELSLASEEHPESAPYVELDGTRALHRIFVIFWAVKEAIIPFHFHVTDIHRDMIWGVLADLLKDGKVWLWVEGDEEKCTDLPQASRYLKESREYVKRKLSCSSRVRLRTPRIPTWSNFRERVSKASFAMRVLVITWATFTSVPVREAGWVRGRADWTRCEIFVTASGWYYPLLGSLGVRNLLVDESRHSPLEAAFKDILRCHGHSCYSSPKYSDGPLQLLLYLRSFLPSTPSGKDVSMIFVEDRSCQQCTKLKELYISSNDECYTSPLSLLVLNSLRLCLDIDTAAWLSVLALGVSRGIISAAILSKTVDDKIRTHLGTDEFDFEYQPWVNRLPSSLRHSVVTCSETEWREAELAVRRENQHQLVPTSPWDSMDIGLGVRITAIYLLMSEHSSQKLTPLEYRNACDDDWIHIFNGPVYPAHIAASVESFCDATSDISTHACCEFRWDDCPLKLRQCYAAAYLLLHPESQDVPLLEPLRRPVSCVYCDFDEDKCWNRCEQCRKLPEAEPLVLTQITESDATIPPADGTDDVVPMLAVVQRHSPVSMAVSQILSGSSQSHGGPPLSKDVILPKLKNYFARLLAEHNIPIQYTNLGAPQLPWCTLPELLRNRRLEIAGWPEDLPLPDATGKHNAKGIMGLTAKDARRLHEALPGISFRRMDKARARPREEESEDDIGNRPTKKVKGKGKAPAEGEKKFRVSEVQKVIRGIHVEKSN